MAEELPKTEETLDELKNQLAQAEKEKSEYLESLKRAKNDLLRYKQEEAKRSEDIILYSNQSLIVTLLPVLDSFDLALRVVQGNTEIKKGFELIRTQFDTVLKNFGLETIRPRLLEDKANPELHEVIGKKTCETPGCKGEDEGLIVDTIAVGYRLHRRLVRPARVMVVTHDGK